ncbi:MAG: RDD family protein [Mycobacterium sp.]
MTDTPPGPLPGDYPPPGNFPPPGGYPPPGYQAGGYYPPAPAGILPREAYTPWITRVLAYIVDSVPVALLVGIGQVVMFSTAENECISDSSDSGFNAVCTSQPTGVGLGISLVLSVLAAIFAIWNFGYRQGTSGSSIGKSVMKFKVVSEKTGQPIGFGLSIVRQLAHIVDSLICYIGYLFPLWDAKRQTIADKIMSTVCLPR